MITKKELRELIDRCQAAEDFFHISKIASDTSEFIKENKDDLSDITISVSSGICNIKQGGLTIEFRNIVKLHGNYEENSTQFLLNGLMSLLEEYSKMVKSVADELDIPD